MSQALHHRLAVAGALVLSLAVVQTARAQKPDAWISAKAKLALLTADDVSVTSVHVDTNKGLVVLHGKVKSNAEKARAEAAVRKVEGVNSVRNLLEVVPDAFKESMNVADSAIKENVEKALKADATLKDIKVDSVNNAVVLLSGKTKDIDVAVRAVEKARDVTGVRRVASQVQLETEMP
jgi:osmotically-inducible protein OsmY